MSHVFKVSTEPSPSPQSLCPANALCKLLHITAFECICCLLHTQTKDSYLVNCLISFLCLCWQWQRTSPAESNRLAGPQISLWTRRQPGNGGKTGDRCSWVPGKLSQGSLGFAAVFSAVATGSWKSWTVPWIVSILCWNKEYDSKILLLLLLLLLLRLIIYLWKL